MDTYLYHIHVKGHLDARWFDWFAGLEITHTLAGETVIVATLDQAALHAILARVRDIGLDLLLVQKIGESTQ
jgi:hypothetical protein